MSEKEPLEKNATSADGYIARTDGDLDWLTDEAIAVFVQRLRESQGKNTWLMGGGEIIASFLDAHAIDEFVISIVPSFVGDGIPLIARRHRHVPLSLLATEKFADGLVQLHYAVQA